jgi:hypothetical protein
MMDMSKPEVAVTTDPEQEDRPHEDRPRVRGQVPLEELARRKGIRPVKSVHDMAQPGVFESDEEVEAFIAHVYASRRANLA